ncbi:neuronal acetylcholine receptor subunit beta-2-like [Convolutriloba macropyga]|uniref:neuronal acetylcholine receptor subunit beta-2-like n=1 Tax=Convolutriloba macropyga TaxID=536237 RepID=UPI003F51BD40
MQNYDPLVRPVKIHSDVITVKAVMSLFQLVQIDSKEETIKTLMFQTLEWYDQFLIWEPGQYEGIEWLRFYQLRLWIPNILPYDDVGDYDPEKYFYTIPVAVHHTGRVYLKQPVLYKELFHDNIEKRSI